MSTETKRGRGRPRRAPDIAIEITNKPARLPINFKKIDEILSEISAIYKANQESINSPTQEEEQIEFWAS